ncbi:hypothetical protein Bca4012_063008 [Brassica carinata]
MCKRQKKPYLQPINLFLSRRDLYSLEIHRLNQAPPSRFHQVSSSSSSSLTVDVFIQPRRRHLHPASLLSSSSRFIVVFVEIHRRLCRDPSSSPSRSIVVSVEIRRRLPRVSLTHSTTRDYENHN